MSSNKPFPSSDLDVFKENSLILDNFVNSQENEHPDRFARKRPTITGIIREAFNVRTDISNMNEALIGQSRWDVVPKNTSLSLGGDNGALNKQAQALFNRTEMLKVHSREALRRTYQEAGLNLVDGSFEEGGELKDQNDVLLYEKTGKVYSWNSVFPKLVDKNSTPDNLDSEWTERSGILLKGIYFLSSFGSLDTDDHREVIQRAFDYLAKYSGVLVFPPRKNGYSVKSEHPSFPGRGLVLDLSANTDKNARGGITLIGSHWDSRISLETSSDITTLFFIPERVNYFKMEGMWFDGKKKCEYSFQASDDYSPFMSLRHTKFYNAKIACARISTFLSEFTGCFFGGSGQDGLRLVGIGSGPVTSVTLTGCYAINNARRGYDMGYLTYCTFNGCAADRNALAYYINVASGVTFNGSGCESCGKGIFVYAYRGLSINTFYMLTVGSEDINNPEPYLIELGSGYGATLQGIRKESGRYHQYILGVTSNATGVDNVTVLDGTVTRKTSYFVPSNIYTRPIKFLRDDSTERDLTINIANVDELITWAKTFSNYDINHNIILQLANGNYDLTNNWLNFISLGGCGRLTIQGDGNNGEGVIIISNDSRLLFKNISCKLILKNMRVSGTVPNNSYVRSWFIDCFDVTLDNFVVLKNGINVGVGIRADDSNISLINNSGVNSTSFNISPILPNGNSVISIPASDTDPVNPGWYPGAMFYLKNPVSTGYIGKVYISAAVGWKNFGLIN